MAQMLGQPFMPWQQLVAARALEHVGSRLCYRDVAVTTPRQSGKSTLVLALILARMLSAPDQTVVYAAQTRLAARVKLFDVWWPLIARSPLRDMFSMTRATGSETLYGPNGSRATLLSGEESGGHGESLDLAILDECWALSEAAEQALRPGLATRKNGQLWLLSTAGNEKSLYWRARVDAGRTTAQLGMTEGVAFFEWSAADDVDVTDPGTWPEFMPALGHTIDASTVQADLAGMPLGQWRRAYANQWPDPAGEGWKVFDQEKWAAAWDG